MNNLLLLLKLFKTYMVLMLLFFSSISYANTSKSLIIHKQLILKANKDQVWSALTDHTRLDKWWNKGVKLDPSIGGKFYEPWGDGQLATGVVLGLTPSEFIEFTWQEKYWGSFEKTTCRFTLKEQLGTTTLDVRHSGWEVFKGEKKRQQLINGFRQGWDSLLLKLKRYVESNQ